MEIDYRTAKGWLKDNERQLLFELSSQLRADAVLLNIGIEYGASLACLRAGNPTATIYGVDLDITKAVSSYECILIGEDSHQLVKEWNRPLDLIFVDGDHGELGVALDAGFADSLKVGGWILFQDVFDWLDHSIIHQVCPGVYAAVEKWFARPDIKQEFEELPSVDTTRVFRRVKAHEQPIAARTVADSGNPYPHIQPGGVAESQLEVVRSQPEVRRSGKDFSRGR